MENPVTVNNIKLDMDERNLSKRHSNSREEWNIMSREKILWFSTLGWSPLAVINTLWGYFKGYNRLPDEIHLFVQKNNERIKKNYFITRAWLEAIYDYYKDDVDGIQLDLKEISLESDGMEEYVDKLETNLGLVLSSEDNKIIIDITILYSYP